MLLIRLLSNKHIKIMSIIIPRHLLLTMLVTREYLITFLPEENVENYRI